MKIAAKGLSTRYDQQHEKEMEARRQSAGRGVFLAYRVFCSKCMTDKPRKGSKQLRPGKFICGECAA